MIADAIVLRCRDGIRIDMSRLLAQVWLAREAWFGARAAGRTRRRSMAITVRFIVGRAGPHARSKMNQSMIEQNHHADHPRHGGDL
jgi:hypothetical protein